MGLDQYLYARLFTAPPLGEGRDLFHGEICEKVLDSCSARDWAMDRPTVEVSVKVGYWRKANHIHKWFVDNCQDGVDDCRNAFVSREQLTELRDLCQQVLADRSKAEELLPTQEGFFFGATDYDEYYWQDLEDTVLVLDRALEKVPSDWNFEYGSSW